MGSTEDNAGRRKEEIQSSLSSIVETSEKWLTRLKKRETRVRLASAFLTTVLIVFVLGVSSLSYIIIRYGFDYLKAVFNNPNQAGPFAISVFLSGIVGGVATYFILKGRHEEQLKELSSLIAEMKKADSQGGITGVALSLADKILTLLPELVRKRNQDSLVFGLVAFVLTTALSGNLGVAILVGVIVWLFFRYEFRKTYEQEISKLEEQKKVFDQRKNDFMETL